MLNKGKVSAIREGEAVATVTPFTGGIVTADLVIPFYLIGRIAVNDVVIYTMFADGTGIILHREDGTGRGGSGISATIENNILKLIADDTGSGGGNTGGNTGGGGSAASFPIDDTLKRSADGVLSVNTADAVEQDNTRPVTSAAVHTVVGNIETLMKLI